MGFFFGRELRFALMRDLIVLGSDVLAFLVDYSALRFCCI